MKIKLQQNILIDKIIYNKKSKKRNPGIDFVRVLGQFAIILTHLLHCGKAIEIYSKHRKQLISLNILTSFHNNSFILISGIVGYRTNKYSNLLYLWLTVLFYSIIIHISFKLFKKNFIEKNEIYTEFFPLIFRRYWYFTTYFGMYLFLPIINKGISCLTMPEFKLIIASTLGIFIFWRDLMNQKHDIFNIGEGYTVIWLLIYYLTGAFIGKYPIKYCGIKKYFFCFICLFLYLFVAFLYINVHIYPSKIYFIKNILFFIKKLLTERMDSLLKITESITLCLFFLQISFNKYIAKVICFLGPMAFDIYLIHNHTVVRHNILRPIFYYEPKNIECYFLILLLLWKSLKIFVLCIIIAYIRSLLFYLMNIRKICINFEEIIFKMIN